MKKIFMAAVIAMSLTTTPAQAIDSRVESAVEWAIEIAKDDTHGYSQGAENATPSHPYTGSREGPDYDCCATCSVVKSYCA